MGLSRSVPTIDTLATNRDVFAIMDDIVYDMLMPAANVVNQVVLSQRHGIV
jgi:hypothetical protein